MYNQPGYFEVVVQGQRIDIEYYRENLEKDESFSRFNLDQPYGDLNSKRQIVMALVYKAVKEGIRKFNYF
jgi:hypothetical protein